MSDSLLFRSCRSKLPESLKYCNEILKELFNKRHGAYAWPFYKPVDAVALNLHDYHDIIKKPMDLSSVKSKLDSRVYSSKDQFANDVRLIFQNCYTYNPETHDVVAMARKLEEVFEQRFKNVPSDDYEPPPKPKAVKTPSLATPASTLGASNPMLPQRELRPHPVQPIKVDDSDSDSDTQITRDKQDWYQRLLQVQDQMRQLEEQIRVLVEESVMRKRRRLNDPQAPMAASNNTQGGRAQSAAASGGPPKRVRKTQPQAKKQKEVHQPPAPMAPVAAPPAPVQVSPNQLRSNLCQG